MNRKFDAAYEKLSWQRWKYLAGAYTTLRSSDPPIPASYGVYLIRAPEPLQRVRGSSTVIYIGQSGGGARRGVQGIGPTKGSPGRLFNTRGADEPVRQSIEQLFPGREFMLECAFLHPGDDPAEMESKLLGAYLADHCELPPANHGYRACVSTHPTVPPKKTQG